MKYPQISIIVAAYRAEDAIEDTLMYLLKKIKYPNYEIIVGIDTNEDKTLKITKKIAKKYKKIRIDYSPVRRGIPGVNNSMLQRAKGEIIVKSDVDFRFESPQTALFRIAEYFKDSSIGGLTYRPAEVGTLPKEIIKKGIVAYMEYFTSELVSQWREHEYPVIDKEVYFPVHCHVFRRKLINRIEPYVHDDAEFGRLILKQGYKLVFASDIKTYGPLLSSLKDFYKQKKRDSIGWHYMSREKRFSIALYYANLLLFFLLHPYKFKLKYVVSFILFVPFFSFVNLIGILKSRNKKVSDISNLIRYTKSSNR